jgi:cytochrome c peroxidase
MTRTSIAALFVGALLCALATIQSAVAADPKEETVRAALGRRLFYDADLSLDGTMACATCHEQRHGFADGNRTHPGITGEPARRNVPGLANVGRRKVLTWGDPRLGTLEAQFLVPVLGTHPVEMGMAGKEGELARRLGANACYRALFKAGFPEEQGTVGMDTIARAISSFQRILISRDTPIDRGEMPSDEARSGQKLFKRDCASCHSGPDYTDDRFHRVAGIQPADRGLGEITGRSEDDGKFRTPSLRNAAVGAPYFHDGASRTLSEAIARHAGIAFKPEEDRAVLAYLDRMTDRTFLTDRRFAYPDEPCEAE